MIECPKCGLKTLETDPRVENYPTGTCGLLYDEGKRKLLTVMFYCTKCGFQVGTGWTISKSKVTPIREDTEFNDYIEGILGKEK